MSKIYTYMFNQIIDAFYINMFQENPVAIFNTKTILVICDCLIKY